MSRTVRIRNSSRPAAEAIRAGWCDSFLCRLRGFMFRRRLHPGEALLLVEAHEGRANTAIHMAFVFVSLGIVWLNRRGVVVDVRRADPWGWAMPIQPAQYTLESGPELLAQFGIGDQTEFLPDEEPH